MKNVLILNYEYPPLGGGAGVCTQEQALGLASVGYNITVVTAYYEGTLAEEKLDNLEVIRLKSKRQHKYKSSVSEMLSWMLCARKFLAVYCRSHHFDICLSHFTFPGGYVARYIKKKFSIPYVVISHGHDIPWFFPRQMFFYHLLLYVFIRRILIAARAVVVLNEDLKKKATSLLPETDKGKAVVIVNGCKTKYFSPAEGKDYTLMRILFAGRLVKQKDPMTFLKAIKILKDRGVKYQVEVIGNGRLLYKMKRYTEKYHLAENVIYRGWVSRDEMPVTYRSAHVFVQTSLAEAMSVAALEALSAGVYLFSTETGTARQMIIRDVNGVLIPKKNPLALADAIQTYYQTKFTLGYRVPDNILKEFCHRNDWANIIDNYHKLLSEITK